MKLKLNLNLFDHLNIKIKACKFGNLDSFITLSTIGLVQL